MIIKTTNYEILIKENIFTYINAELAYLKPNSKLFLVTDDNIFSLYKDNILNIVDENNIIVIKHGEINKNYHTYLEIIDELLVKKIKRDDLLIAFGGGVVGDLTGFVAATLYRGLDYVQIPTTLLAQIDSSIGGKVGINYHDNKNIIGNFYNPLKVFIDPLLLKTLEYPDYKDGIAEMIKISLLADDKLFKHLQNKNPITINEIALAIKLKNAIVNKDFYDKNLRMILNFGHTFGHQIEINENLSHGVAISYGMLIALEIGIKLNKTNKDLYSVLKRILISYDLINEPLINKSDYLDLIWDDKKHFQDGLKFVILNDIMKPEIVNIKKGDIF